MSRAYNCVWSILSGVDRVIITILYLRLNCIKRSQEDFGLCWLLCWLGVTVTHNNRNINLFYFLWHTLNIKHTVSQKVYRRQYRH